MASIVRFLPGKIPWQGLALATQKSNKLMRALVAPCYPSTRSTFPLIQRLPFTASADPSSSSPSSSPPSANTTSTLPNAPALTSEELLKQDVTKMTDEELMNTDDIPGWHLIHNPPRNIPLGSMVGTVVSTKMQKTINVAVNRYKMIRKIQYRVRFTRKFFAHDENEVANMGDIVLITPCHKMSKRKHFMLSEIIRAKDQL